jgi:hypothetical protein
MPKQYFFEAGSFQDLSYVELVSVFRLYGVTKDYIQKFTDKIFIIRDKNVSSEIIDKVFNRLGGFVRYGYVIDQIDTFLSDKSSQASKVTFGISILGFLRKLSNEIKD